MNPYDVIRRPLLTEKSTKLKEHNTYCFEVSDKANKVDIRQAVEKLFRVDVLGVRTMQYRGKMKRLGRFAGRKRNWKKAMVTIKEGATIELFEGV